MNVSVGLMEGRSAVEVELTGVFTDASGKSFNPGRHQFTSEITLIPKGPASSAFALDDMTIGIGFHWERKERQVFRGGLRIIKRDAGLTVINDVPLEEYVTSVISSEMSATCPLERERFPLGEGRVRVSILMKFCAGTAAKPILTLTSAPTITASAIRASRKPSPLRLPKLCARQPVSSFATTAISATRAFRNAAAV